MPNSTSTPVAKSIIPSFDRETWRQSRLGALWWAEHIWRILREWTVFCLIPLEWWYFSPTPYPISHLARISHLLILGFHPVHPNSTIRTKSKEFRWHPHPQTRTGCPNCPRHCHHSFHHRVHHRRHGRRRENWRRVGKGCEGEAWRLDWLRSILFLPSPADWAGWIYVSLWQKIDERCRLREI